MYTLLLPQHRLHPQGFVTTAATSITLPEYQLYAVEKWIVDRHRQLTLLVVYTGDPAHRISLTAYTPSPSLSTQDAQATWDKAIALLRADGAKPKQTPHGVLMVTSLAHFRSDYTIVQIPGGNFLAVKDQLYANINLLRMGCSGRTALTLEDPSDTTKERFISSYHLPETTISNALPVPMPTSLESLPLLNQPPASPPRKNNPHIGLGRPSTTLPTNSNAWAPNHSTSSLPSRKEKDKFLLHGKTKERSTFLITVLELVKLIQAGLAIFGMYGPKDSSSTLVLDGLLCDDTVDGIRTWIECIGPLVGLEPTERIADPMFVSGLLSLVLTVRNKLACLGYSNVLPRDPFLYPHAFSHALAAYSQSITSGLSTSAHTPASSNSTTHQFHSYPHTFTSPHLSISHIAHHVSTTTPSHSTNASPLIPPAPPPTNLLSAAAAAAAAAVTPVPQPAGAVLTRELVESISNAYENRQKSENRKVRRVIKNKLAHSGGGAKSLEGGGGVDSDGAVDDQRDRERRTTLSLTLSGGEGPSSREADRDRAQALSAALSQNAVGSQSTSNIGGAGGGGGVSSVGGGGPGIGSSGGQILSGIGSLASGLGLSGASSSTAGLGLGDASALVIPTVDLSRFVVSAGAGAASAASGSRGDGGGKSKKKRKSLSKDLTSSLAGHSSTKEDRRRTESVDSGIGIGYAYNNYAHAREKELRELRDGVVGGSVKALWSGRVGDVVRMREWDADGLGSKGRRGTGGEARSVASDGDGDESYPGTRRYDGRSTEDESDVLGSVDGSIGRSSHGMGGHSFGGMWGGRVRGKLGSWAGLGRRKHQSVDLTTMTATSSMNSSLRAPGPGHNNSNSSSKQSKEKESSPQPPAERLSKLVIGSSTAQNGGSPSQSVLSNGHGYGYGYYGSPASGSVRSRRPMLSRQSTGGGGGTGSGPQSPTLPPMIFSGDGQDDDDLLSSGQVSPLSDYRPSPFNLITGNGHSADNNGDRSASGSTTNLDEHALAKLLSQNQKRPFAIRRLAQQPRISSWADPVSGARELDGEDVDEGDVEGGGEDGDEDGDGTVDGDGDSARGRPPTRTRLKRRDEKVVDDDEEESDISELRSTLGSLATGKRKEKARFHSLLSVVDGEGVRGEERMEDASDDESDEDEEDEDVDEERKEELRRRSAGFDMRRRRSFHDLDTFRGAGVEVLSRDHMRIDVELCGQLLIMRRREDHLRNVVACVQIIAKSLSQTNSALREHYESHVDNLGAIDVGSKVIPEIEEASVRIDKFSQATNALRYESEQFSVNELWQAASPPRHKVFALREKVFGLGGRRLPPGVNGAHGSFNRLQWTLDGQKRLVDYLGRTESEAEEERRIDPHGVFGIGEPTEPEDDEDVVEHPGIKPMWLLRFFTSWGARWSAAAAKPPPVEPPASGTEVAKSPSNSPPPPPSSLSASLAPSPVSVNEKQAVAGNGTLVITN